METVPKTRSRQRWLRFGLRTWLLGFTALVVAIGLWSQSALRQRRAVEKLEQLNVAIGYDCESGSNQGEGSPIPRWLLDWIGYDFFHNVVEIQQHSRSTRKSTKAIIGELTAFPHLKFLWFSSVPGVRDADLERISGLRELEDLQLCNSREISHQGLAHLRKLTRLRCLGISGPPITNECIAVISEIRTLTTLQLDYVELNQANLERLGRMTRLTYLDISGSPILGADDLKHFFGLVHLTQFDLPECILTKAEADRLQQALPNCAISFFLAYVDD